MDSFPRCLNPNKHLIEQFVSNLPGSSMLEVSALLNNVASASNAFAAHFLLSDSEWSLKSYLASVALDYVFIVLPTFLIFTNTFIQDGKEMASVLYTYRSCVKALPQGVCWNSQFGIQKLAAETGTASIYCGFWF
ncbi:hypothetical protein GOBAR_AA09829 [Gossypium barbadense]|uniref:Uncharacterized protein n=1 Tax=Gossypium barbadense TaxID=3634 RepID=A0A2P5Y5E0_GOSBA|nr:hypothetical protein GOBAR_AA09829 [Gossypium barbadense]